jgi:hypothetical protein
MFNTSVMNKANKILSLAHFLRFVLILYSHLILGLERITLPGGFPTQNRVLSLVFYLVVPSFVAPMSIGEEYKPRSYSKGCPPSCHLLPLCASIPFDTPFLNALSLCSSLSVRVNFYTKLHGVIAQKSAIFTVIVIVKLILL